MQIRQFQCFRYRGYKDIQLNQKPLFQLQIVFPVRKIKMKRSNKRLQSDEDYSDSFRDQYELRERRMPSTSSPQQKSRKISQAKKELLISMVTKENYRIKEAGRILGISYSTAKKIFTIFRNELRAKKESDEDQLSKYKACLHCKVKESGGDAAQHVFVISTLAGRPQREESQAKTFNYLQ